MKPLKIETGFPPPTTVLFLTLSITLMMVALSGMGPVLKDRMPRYCFLLALSPRLNVVAVLLIAPPMPLVSDLSSIQPSCSLMEVNATVTTLGVRVFVGVLVAVWVGVKVK